MCIFGSDSRPLFKKGTFEILAMPEGYIRQYRYRPQHVNYSVEDLETCIGLDCVVFFTSGNDLKIEKKDRAITNTSIREGTIVDAHFKSDTGLIHFYIKLGKFKTVKIAINPTELLPPFKFVSELQIQDIGTPAWHEKIDELKNHFPEQVFINFKLLDSKSSNIINPIYDRIHNHCYYFLQDEKRYILELSFYDIGQAENFSLKISKENKEVFKIAAPEDLRVGVKRDNQKYTIYTQSLNSIETYSYIYLILSNANTNNFDKEILIPIHVKKNRTRTFLFGLYSVLAGISIVYIKLISDVFSLHGNLNFTLISHCIVALSLAFIASYQLYAIFNKKQ